MIDRNLGNAERLIRLLLGLTFGYWTLSQPHLNVTEWFVGLVAMMLILNGVFSRCYLWYVLDLDSRPKCEI